MKSPRVWVIVAIAAVGGLLIGRWAGESATTEAPPPETQATPPKPRSRLVETSPVPPRAAERPARMADAAAVEAGALPGQRSLVFSSPEALEAFLARLEGTGIAVLGRLDALNALRVGFFDLAELEGLLDGSEETGFIFPVSVPGQGEVQEGAVGFGDRWIEWLGLPEDRSGWGKGVVVAVIDSGVVSHSAFANPITEIDFTDGAAPNGHGTAVAGLIGGTEGIAPDAPLLSIRVANENGTANTFLLAEAIIAAADRGAQLINISMGQSSHSPLLRRAVEYAQSKGALIVASAGNDGRASVTFPAAYEDVVSAGAVDARGEHLMFSNTGNVVVTAPGLALTSPWLDNGTTYFSGTSASAPLVTGTLAVLISRHQLSPAQALELLLANSNEAGAPGRDASYGRGVIDPGRALRSKGPAYLDAAVASNYYSPRNSSSGTLQVTVENRGLSPLVNAPLEVSGPFGSRSFNVSSLPAGRTATFEIPFSPASYGQGSSFSVTSSIGISHRETDFNRSNNRRTDVIARPAR